MMCKICHLIHEFSKISLPWEGDHQCCNRVRLESHTRTLPVARAVFHDSFPLKFVHDSTRLEPENETKWLDSTQNLSDSLQPWGPPRSFPSLPRSASPPPPPAVFEILATPLLTCLRNFWKRHMVLPCYLFFDGYDWYCFYHNTNPDDKLYMNSLARPSTLASILDTGTVKAPVFGTLNNAISKFQTLFVRTVMEVLKYCWM